MCPECGEVVVPSPERLGQNKIVGVTYFHQNLLVGCGWKLIDATRYAQGQLLGLRENVPDGIDPSGRPKFKDEHDMCKDTSFNLLDLVRAVKQFAQNLVAGRTTTPRSGAAENRELTT
jgi:hypothetical protein